MRRDRHRDLTLDAVRGRSIMRCSWVADAVFAVTTVPFVLGVDALEGVSIAVSLLCFAASLVVWVWAFAVAFSRSAEGDDIAVASLFVTMGGAPPEVRWQLFGALGACVVIVAGTAAEQPFGVLVPMLPLGLVGLWAAKYGAFPPRRGSAGPRVGGHG